MLKFYNTLTRKKEEFKPIKKGVVGMYTCGPTVYWYQHIGNMRAYFFTDLLRRVLEFNNYKVKQIINITDVGHLTSDGDFGEDKMEMAAAKEGKKAQDIAKFYFDIFLEDLKKLNIQMPERWCRATEHIHEQIALIQTLEKKGYTYRTDDGIYFNTSKFKDYGKLAKLKKEGLQAGKRTEMRKKKNKTDFALWKFSGKPGLRQQEWNSPWGLGFPGWHVECSAMSMKYLGEHFDIHTGGEDHIPIHHTNEIAQSESATGKKFVNYWMHEAFLTFKGEKVSKSKGGLYTLKELEDLGYLPENYRYFMALTHYGKPLDFSIDKLDAAKKAFERIKRKILELKNISHPGGDRTKEYLKKFSDAINDDINTPLAVQVFIKAMNDISFDTKKKIELLEKFDSILGLGVKEMKESKLIVPKDINELVKQREEARKEKRWADADILRKKIREKGFLIEDEPDGPNLIKE